MNPALPATEFFITDQIFGIFDGDEWPVETAEWSNGLVAVMAVGALIRTGIAVGRVAVVVDVRDTPAPLSTEPWEEVVEVSVEAPRGELHVVSVADSFLHSLPLLSSGGPGEYRIRVHARGRELGYDLTSMEPTEQYLIISWPARSAPVEILKSNSLTALPAALSSLPSQPADGPAIGDPALAEPGVVSPPSRAPEEVRRSRHR